MITIRGNGIESESIEHALKSQRGASEIISGTKLIPYRITSWHGSIFTVYKVFILLKNLRTKSIWSRMQQSELLCLSATSAKLMCALVSTIPMLYCCYSFCLLFFVLYICSCSYIISIFFLLFVLSSHFSSVVFAGDYQNIDLRLL